eukprot:TRINITY_DN8137_c0_g1_i1.p1 TRINITY_DN8137_c0_g1~~TRINITY_DN8137_c0_g1_i1.p1  ORF type:complete len:446 (+),score=86.43 TRINITY_DN8137_c0_g1_i1:36-1373(+)
MFKLTLLLCLIALLGATADPTKIDRVFVIYLENWSFDGLFGLLPNVNGLKNFNNQNPQTDLNGTIYKYLPQDQAGLTPPFQSNEPFELIFPEGDIPNIDITHRYFQEQFQIDGGHMDRTVAWSTAKGAVMSYVDLNGWYYGELAKQYTILDNFYHSAFGGSFLNHQWLVSARTPVWYNVSQDQLNKYSVVFDKNGNFIKDGIITPWPSTDFPEHYAVNTIESINPPYNPAGWSPLLPSQNHATIGDTLSAAGVSWRYYSGGYRDAMEGHPGPDFQYHHQPFLYFDRFADPYGEERTEHIRDETDFLNDLINCTCPQVSWIKPYGRYNFHPGTAQFNESNAKLEELVTAIQKSCYWENAAIIITHDEHGGRWDHVAPPTGNKWGPGTRIPAVVVSPFVKQGYTDSTQLETISIIKFLEEKYNLSPSLIPTDRNVISLSKVFPPGSV